MEVQEKYLPALEDRKLFIENRIEEYKKQVFGGVVEAKLAEANGEKRAIEVQEDAIKQLTRSIDALVDISDNLE